MCTGLMFCMCGVILNENMLVFWCFAVRGVLVRSELKRRTKSRRWPTFRDCNQGHNDSCSAESRFACGTRHGDMDLWFAGCEKDNVADQLTDNLRFT